MERVRRLKLILWTVVGLAAAVVAASTVPAAAQSGPSRLDAAALARRHHVVRPGAAGGVGAHHADLLVDPGAPGAAGFVGHARSADLVASSSSLSCGSNASGVPPCAETRNIFRGFLGFPPRKAIWLPSCDHEGRDTCQDESVSCRRSLPSRRLRQRMFSGTVT